MGSAVSLGLRNALTVVGAFAMLVATSPKLAGLIAIVIPLVIGPMLLFGRREKKFSRASQERIADLGAFAEETINGLRAVQAFTWEAVARQRFDEATELSFATARRRVRTRALLILVVILLGFGAVTFSLWVGGRDVVRAHDRRRTVRVRPLRGAAGASGASLSEVWGDVQRASGRRNGCSTVGRKSTVAAPARPRPCRVRPGAVSST